MWRLDNIAGHSDVVFEPPSCHCSTPLLDAITRHDFSTRFLDAMPGTRLLGRAIAPNNADSVCSVACYVVGLGVVLHGEKRQSPVSVLQPEFPSILAPLDFEPAMTSAPASSMDLNKILAGAQLAALPQSAIRLLELSQDPENGPEEFAIPIESDPGLTGQVLRFVNSSYFGFSREISSVKLAITLVGIRTIKNFTLWSAIFSLMPAPQCGPLTLSSLWQDSLRRSLFARAMATLLGMKEAEEPFAAALLQDMAVPLLAKEIPDIYVKLLDARQDGKFRLSDLEQAVFGWTHAHAAGIMARQWNLPDDFAVLVENHQAIDRWVTQPDKAPGNLAVAMSALLPTVADPLWKECDRFEAYYEKVRPSEGPSAAELLCQIDKEFAEFAPVLKIATPGKSLVESHQEMTTAAG